MWKNDVLKRNKTNFFRIFRVFFFIFHSVGKLTFGRTLSLLSRISGHNVVGQLIFYTASTCILPLSPPPNTELNTYNFIKFCTIFSANVILSLQMPFPRPWKTNAPVALRSRKKEPKKSSNSCTTKNRKCGRKCWTNMTPMAATEKNTRQNQKNIWARKSKFCFRTCAPVRISDNINLMRFRFFFSYQILNSTTT